MQPRARRRAAWDAKRSYAPEAARPPVSTLSLRKKKRVDKRSKKREWNTAKLGPMGPRGFNN
jgi:hypothetical protein